MSISRRQFVELLGSGMLLSLTTCNPTQHPERSEVPPLSPKGGLGTFAPPDDEMIYAPPTFQQPPKIILPPPPKVSGGTPGGKDVIMPAPDQRGGNKTAAQPPATPPAAGGKLTPTSPAVAAADGVIPRGAWTRATPIMGRVEPMGGVMMITFHHSGDREPFLSTSLADTIEHLEITRSYHITPRAKGGAGMCDIGYHYAIDRAGRVWQLRSTRYQGEHVRDHNPHNLGVVLLGNFELQKPTDAQLDRAIKFGRQLRAQYNLPIKKVFTHRELHPTICPGKYAQPFFLRIRQQKLI